MDPKKYPTLADLSGGPSDPVSRQQTPEQIDAVMRQWAFVQSSVEAGQPAIGR